MAEDINIDNLLEEMDGGGRGSGFMYQNEFLSINKSNDKTTTNNNDINEYKDNEKLNVCFLNLKGWLCVINLMACAVGSGVFAYPSIMFNIGIGYSIIGLIVLIIPVYFSLDLLRRFAVDTKLFSYSSIIQATLGYFWVVMYDLSSFLFYMLGISTYLKSLFNITDSVIPGLNDNTFGKVFYYIITYIIELALCLFTSNLSKISYLSLIVICLFIIILIRTIIESIYNMSTETERFDYVTAFVIKGEDNSWDKFLSFTSKINDIFFGFLSHCQYPLILNTYEDGSNEEKTKKINKIQLFFVSILYFLFTFFGLFCLDEENPAELFLNKRSLDNFGEYLFNILLMIYLLALTAIRYTVIKDNYLSILKKDFLSAKYEIIILAICVLINNLVITILEDSKIRTIFVTIFTGLFGVFFCFVLPVINYIKINGKTKTRSIIGYIISVFFLLIGIFSIIYSLKKATKD